MRTVDQIRQARHAQPFRPFGIKVADGTIYTVKHPDFIAVPPGMRPREIAFFAEGVARTEDYETHGMDLGLEVELIVPSEAGAMPARAEGDGE
jgi:hypothetical protein